MYQKARPLFLVAESPLHAGSGSDLGDIDLPIQRESHTGYPKVEASSLKGALRQAFEANAPQNNTNYLETLNRVFGYDKDGLPEEVKSKFTDKTDFAGALGLTDARILLFPVKSLRGTFAWVTCPTVLKRFQHEMGQVSNPSVPLPEEINKIDKNMTVTGQHLEIATKRNDDNAQIQLENYIYEDIDYSKDVDKLADWLAENVLAKAMFKEKVKGNLVVLPDDDFTDFVKFSTEVVTRTKIDNETGTVKSGGLFTEEYLPSETVMYSLAMFSNEFKANGMTLENVEGFFKKPNYFPKHFQLGANATLGKGIMNAYYLNGNEKPE